MKYQTMCVNCFMHEPDRNLLPDGVRTKKSGHVLYNDAS